MRDARRFLDFSSADALQSTYSYTPGRGPTLTMTTVGLLCRQYLG